MIRNKKIDGGKECEDKNQNEEDRCIIHVGRC